MTRFATVAAVLALGLMGAVPVLARDDSDTGTRVAHEDGRGVADFAAMHAELCKDMYAREVGRTAYLEAKLALTPAQETLFASWKAVVLQNAQARSTTCASMTRPATRPSVLDMMAHEQTMLQDRLSALQAEMPALTALYQSLTPEQKTAFEGDGHRHGRDGRGGPFGRGPDGHGGHDGPPRGDDNGA